jgi:hypothetical protein
MTDERTTYRDVSPWPGLADAIFWGSIAVCCYPLLAGWGTDLPLVTRLLAAGSIMFVAVGLKLLMGGLTVLVKETHVLVHLGSIPIVKKVIPFSEIYDLESIRYRPFVEFGGWGLSGTGKKRAWTSRGDQAVVLTLSEERRLYYR